MMKQKVYEVEIEEKKNYTLQKKNIEPTKE